MLAHLKRILDMLERSYFAEYEKISKKIIQYNGFPPLNIIEKYEEILAKLREHLYQNKIKTPLAVYPYNPRKKNTHCFILNRKNQKIILNHNYIYRNSWERIDGVKMENK
jgi:hypothetical protein